jgi:predicted nucleic acid-binding protein
MSRTAYFADTWFWIGLIHEPDQHHKAARAIYKKIGDAQIVTSEMVLTEVLNVFRKFGPRWRDYVDLLRARAEIVVVAQTSDYFRRGLVKYR